MQTNRSHRRPNCWDQPVRIVLLLGALLVLAGFSSPLPSAPARAQAVLLQIAADQPDTHVRVIVQKQTQGRSVEELVAQLGGVVVNDLSIINAFAADLPAQTIPQLARAQGVRWISLDAPVESTALGNTSLAWATAIGPSYPNTFDSAAIIDSGLGPNQVYGSGGLGVASFTGFQMETTPGYAITKVEAILQVYVPAMLKDNLTLSVYLGGKKLQQYNVQSNAFDYFVGKLNAGPMYVDITNNHTWQWADFENRLEIALDQTRFQSWEKVYYDAIGLRVTSVPGGVGTYADPALASPPKGFIDSSKLKTVYPSAVRAPSVWNDAPAYLQGQGVTIAVVDSGVYKNRDLDQRLIASVNFNDGYHSAADVYGHGTFVATVIAGDGTQSNGMYIGIAPKANILNIRVSNDLGVSTESDVVAGLQYVLQTKDKYNTRVVNLSLNSRMAQSYHTSPLDAAAEILWFNGIVVVASVGNNPATVNGKPILYPPANDPFVISVGATDDKGTAKLADDTIAAFSAYGATETGGVKPELVAPGTNIVSLLTNADKTTIGRLHGANKVGTSYFRMSGTSMSAPMVSGAAALLLQDEPTLTPDQVKYRLMLTANRAWKNYSSMKAGFGYLDIYAAIRGTTTQSSNTGLAASRLLWTGDAPVLWKSVNWDSVNWDSVNWDSVNWDSVNWDSVNWDSDYWGP
ncbi:MAG: S8 family peptidase [Chloroflexi bacterium]|nr:S8 family peptidase [Chloroflexota bacterium]